MPLVVDCRIPLVLLMDKFPYVLLSTFLLSQTFQTLLETSKALSIFLLILLVNITSFVVVTFRIIHS